jgi:hypothetical protein
MTLLDLLPIKDDQVDIVLGAVRDWRAENGSSIDDEKGREAMAVAVKLAAGAVRTRHELIEALSRDIMCH